MLLKVPALRQSPVTQYSKYSVRSFFRFDFSTISLNAALAADVELPISSRPVRTLLKSRVLLAFEYERVLFRQTTDDKTCLLCGLVWEGVGQGYVCEIDPRMTRSVPDEARVVPSVVRCCSIVVQFVDLHLELISYRFRPESLLEVVLQIGLRVFRINVFERLIMERTASSKKIVFLPSMTVNNRLKKT